VQSEDGCVHAEFAKVLTNLLELYLQRGHLIAALLELSLDLAITAILSDDEAHEPALTSGNLSAREENG